MTKATIFALVVAQWHGCNLYGRSRYRRCLGEGHQRDHIKHRTLRMVGSLICQRVGWILQDTSSQVTHPNTDSAFVTVRRRR